MLEGIRFRLSEIQTLLPRSHVPFPPTHVRMDNHSPALVGGFYKQLTSPHMNPFNKDIREALGFRNPTPQLIRQQTDTRPYWLRVNHWLYRLASHRQMAGSGAVLLSITDNRQKWKRKFRDKSSLLVSNPLTKQ